MYPVIRRYSGASALAQEMVGRKRQEVEDLLRGVPGFVAYYALREGDQVATVTVCQDQAGTEESSRRAAGWVKQNMAGAAVLSAPDVFGGEVYLDLSR